MARHQGDLLTRLVWFIGCGWLTTKEPCSLGESGLLVVDGSPSWKPAHSVSLLVYRLWMVHHQEALLNGESLGLLVVDGSLSNPCSLGESWVIGCDWLTIKESCSLGESLGLPVVDGSPPRSPAQR